MNEVLELLKSANNYLVDFDNHLINYGFAGDEALGALIENIEKILQEWEILKTGHLART